MYIYLFCCFIFHDVQLFFFLTLHLPLQLNCRIFFLMRFIFFFLPFPLFGKKKIQQRLQEENTLASCTPLNPQWGALGPYGSSQTQQDLASVLELTRQLEPGALGSSNHKTVKFCVLIGVVLFQDSISSKQSKTGYIFCVKKQVKISLR